MKLSKKEILIGIFAPLVIALTFVIVAGNMVKAEAIKALPPSAENIREFHNETEDKSVFFTGIKAELPEQDLATYVQNLGLSQQYNSAIHVNLLDEINVHYSDVPDWWDEPEAMNVCYFHHDPYNKQLVRVKWHNGWVYFFSSSWK